MMLAVSLLFITQLVATGICQFNVTSQEEMVDLINNMNTTWTAQINFQNLTIDQMPTVCSNHINPENMPLQEVQLMPTIPVEFDARNKWSHCQTVHSIYHQGDCGSCWAFGTAGVMSDRICIHNLGNNVVISPQNLVTCCAPKYGRSNGCKGAPTHIPFICWIYDGVVTEGCQPYTLDTLEDGEIPPQCSKTCTSGYFKSYSDDLYYGKKAYEIPSDVASIQSEIMRNGPITVGFRVYEDLYRFYRNGIYRYLVGDFLGYHAVKMIGWGEENGVPYWLLANSWGTGWGRLGGFFKVLRGVNEVGIESNPIAGIPSNIATNSDGTNGAPSLRKDFQVITMSGVIISLLAAAIITHYI